MTEINPSATHWQARFLDALLDTYELKNDAALARAIKVSPVVISKVRGDRTGISRSLILSVHEGLGMQVAMIRTLMADAL